MVTQTAYRAGHAKRTSLFAVAIGAIYLSLNGCAEIEVGVEVFKNIPRASNVPPAQPVVKSSAVQDSIEPSMRADPQAFHATGLALWDGSQTLQGVWIAHPMAQIARRVRLTNDETGAQVDAAMFRRDANLSGPQLIVSAEAARLLGLKPGHGTQITIDGLAYRTDIEATPVVASARDEVTPSDIDGMPVEETAVEQVDAEAATASPALPTSRVYALELAPESDPAGAQPVAVVTKFETVETRVAPDPVIPDNSSNDVSAPAGGKTAQAPELGVQQPVSSPPPKQTAKPVAAAPKGSGDIADGQRFVQAGVFSQSENATRLVATLRAAGLPANELPITLGNRQFTRVLVGPYQSVAERDAALDTVRRIGPADATTARG